MKADYTRLTFKREKHYNGVRMQQGRVQVDADWNEQMDIQAHLRNTQSTDVVGACGAPRLNGGFKIEALGDKSDLSISPGRMYAGGLLCELEEGFPVDVTDLNTGNKTLRIPFLSVDGNILFAKDQWVAVLAEGLDALIAQITKIEEKTGNNSTYFEVTIDPGEADLSVFEGAVGLRIRRIISYKAQTNYRYHPDTDAPTDAGLYAAYLDVWERHITAIEDAAIREVALGGPDTATRTQTLWQVKLMKVDDTNSAGAPLTCWDTPSPWAVLIEQSKGLMSARAAASQSETRPCIISAAIGYRRLENQLYRVEIHKAGKAGEATFKWSRDNGIVVSRVEQIIAGQRALVVSNAGRDAVLSFGSGQWVELIDEGRVLRGEPGLLLKLAPGEENTLVVDEATWNDIKNKDYRDELLAIDLSKTLVTVRRWDQKSTSSEEGAALVDGAVPVPLDTTTEVDLEEGVKVRFHGGDENYYYNTGDYWLIPARTVGGDVEWPKDGSKNPIPQPPHGIYHHYCKLALVHWDGTMFSNEHDCRPLFPALNEPDLVYVSGDGQEAMPDTPLPQPLRVGVFNCNRPVEGAWVMFKVKEGNGLLQPPVINDEDGNPQFPRCVLDLNGNAITGPVGNIRGTGLIVPTDQFGQAYCIWHMQHVDPETTAFEQLVEATLLQLPQDIDENKLDTPVMFGASLAVAWEDRYGGSDFPDIQHPGLKVDNVEDATDQLRQNIALYYVSGDGQEIMRRRYDGETRESLPMPLQVRVANGDWPFKGAKVKFAVTAGSGTVAITKDTDGSADITIETDDKGIAQCYWLLDEKTWSQQVTATLENTLPSTTDNFVVFPSEVSFNASLSVAEEVTYDGSAFPDEQYPVTSEDPGLVVDTVEDALDQLRQNVALYYVSGDGQEAKPAPRKTPVGDSGPGPEKTLLSHPLQVRVANGDWPFNKAKVVFEVRKGNGSLSETDAVGNVQQLTVDTDENGIAQCYWALDDYMWTQQVTATLDKLPVATPTGEIELLIISDSKVSFNANLSVAEEVTYDGARFPESQHETLAAPTVETSLDQLRENIALYYVSGDGQEARRGESVPSPLQVRVANGDWPFEGATVKFEITTGDGGIGSIGNAELVGEPIWGGSDSEQIVAFLVKTDKDGLAECLWRLGNKNQSQQVTASLVSAIDPETGNVVVFPSEVRFNATLSIAEEVTYDGARFPETQHKKLTAPDVEKALDQLRENIALYYVGGDGQEITRYPQDRIIAFPGPIVPGPGPIAPVPGPIVPGPGPIAPVPGPIVPGPGPIAPVPGPVVLGPALIVPGPGPMINFVFVTKELPKRLQVRAANGDWPFQGAVVKFRISEGKGDIQPVADVPAEGVEKEFGRVIAFTVKTDPAGLAECRWRLDPGTPSQQVTASLMNRLGETEDLQVVFPSEVNFNATLSTADKVSYDPPAGKVANTVQTALNDLYATKVDRAGDTITGSLIIQGNLTVQGDRTEVNVKEMVVEDNILRVNRFEDATNPQRYSGLEVYRGRDAAGNDNPTGQLLWDDKDNKWKIGRSDEILADVAYGPNWVTLTNGSNADALHKHAGLYSPTGKLALSVDDIGNISISSPDVPEQKLEVSGTVKAKTFVGDGSQLTNIKSSQWIDGANGAIYYNGGNVGIGVDIPQEKLHVAGSAYFENRLTIDQRLFGGDAGLLIKGNIPNNNYPNIGLSLRNTSKIDVISASINGMIVDNNQGKEAMHLCFYTRTGQSYTEKVRITSSGNVGIGAAGVTARLSIVASGAAELAGLAKSSTVNTSSGVLGPENGSELALASFGFNSKNNSSFGIRAYRVATGGDWTTTAIGLGMDVDDTVRAGGASLWLNANGNVGIGTNNAAQRLHIYGESNPTVLRLQSAKAFGTARMEFWSDPRASANEWRPGFIQSTDNGTFTGGLAFFVNGTGADAKTGEREVMRLVNGKVGIGISEPKAELHVVGQIYATGAIFYNNTLADAISSTVISTASESFSDVAGMSATVYVPRPASIRADMTSSRMSVDVPFLGEGIIYFVMMIDGQVMLTQSRGFSNDTDTGVSFGTGINLTEGPHVIKIQWRVTGGNLFGHTRADLYDRRLLIQLS